jgi:hypothetical protein
MAEDVESIPVEDGEGSKPTGDGDTSTGQWPAEVQAEYTKKTQALAEERKAWDARRTQEAQQLQQYQNQLAQNSHALQRAQQQAAQQQSQAQTGSMLDQLRGMSYIDGNTAAQLMERIINEGLSPIHQQQQQRDQALSMLASENKTLKAAMEQSHGRQAEQDLTAQYAAVREQHGLPDNEHINRLLKDVYLSYTDWGENSTEYGEKIGNRVEGLRKTFREMDREAALKAKQSPFPSRGGEASLASGKTGGYKTPEERTNELWPMLNPGQIE